jgi:5-methylcytosine-specific restriction endonuclease McrA
METVQIISEGISVVITSVGAILLLCAWLLAVGYGFQRRILWGLLLLFIPYFLVVFAFVDKEHRRSWLSLLGIGSGIIIVGSLFESSIFLALLATVAIVILAYLMRNKLTNLNIGFSTIAPQEAISAGIVLNTRRFDAVTKRYSKILDQVPGGVNSRLAMKSFGDTNQINDVSNFHDKHFAKMINEHSGSIVKSIDWNDERISMFKTLMYRKHNVQPALGVALLLYVAEEREYKNYSSQFSEILPKTPDRLMQEVVLHDIYNGISSPRVDNIERLMLENGAKKTNTLAIERSYKSTKEAIKLQHFEKSLGIDNDKPFVSIEDDIRTTRQYARINSNLSEFLDVNPDGFVIVNNDFVRESRLDRHYRANFSYTLSRAFSGHCCKCGEGMGQLEFDHFWLPKSKGGNFLMRSVDGLYVNNCIPLCRSCNASKGARDYRDFFDEDELIDIVQTSQSINKHINMEMVDFHDSDFKMRAY